MDKIFTNLDNILVSALTKEQYKPYKKYWFDKDFRQRYDHIFGEDNFRILLDLNSSYNIEDLNVNAMFNKKQYEELNEIYNYISLLGYELKQIDSYFLLNYINGFLIDIHNDKIDIKQIFKEIKNTSNDKLKEYYKKQNDNKIFNSNTVYKNINLNKEIDASLMIFFETYRKKIKNICKRPLSLDDIDYKEKYEQILTKYNIKGIEDLNINKNDNEELQKEKRKNSSNFLKEINNLVGIDVLNTINLLCSLFYNDYKKIINAENLIYNYYINKKGEKLIICNTGLLSESNTNNIITELYNKLADSIRNDQSFDIMFKQSKSNNFTIAKLALNQKIKELEDNFNIRPSLKILDMKFKAIISRLPYDIAGMSTDRRWTSCMSLPGDKAKPYGGINYHYVDADLKEGTLISYLIEENDIHIKKPWARLLIKPYFLEKNDNDNDIKNSPDIYLCPAGQVYNNNDIFKELLEIFHSTVLEFFENKQKDAIGIYNLSNKVYVDTSDQTSLEFEKPDIALIKDNLPSEKSTMWATQKITHWNRDKIIHFSKTKIYKCIKEYLKNNIIDLLIDYYISNDDTILQIYKWNSSDFNCKNIDLECDFWHSGIFLGNNLRCKKFTSGTFKGNGDLYCKSVDIISFHDKTNSSSAFIDNLYNNGTFYGGDIYISNFANYVRNYGGAWCKGEWYNGIWYDGEWLNGTWNKGEIESKKYNKKLILSYVNPEEFYKLELESNSLEELEQLVSKKKLNY